MAKGFHLSYLKKTQKYCLKGIHSDQKPSCALLLLDVWSEKANSFGRAWVKSEDRSPTPWLPGAQGVTHTWETKLRSAVGFSLLPDESESRSGATALIFSAPPFQVPSLLPFSNHPTKGAASQCLPAPGVAPCQPPAHQARQHAQLT